MQNFLFVYSLCFGYIFTILIMNTSLGQVTHIKQFFIYFCKINFFNKLTFYISLISIIFLILYLFEVIIFSSFIENFNTEILYLTSEDAGGSQTSNALSQVYGQTATVDQTHTEHSPERTNSNLNSAIADNNLNINTPHINLSLSPNAIQRIATVATTGAGLNAGVRLAKSMPSIPGKAACLISTVALAHAANITANKLTSKIDTSDKEENISTSLTNKYLQGTETNNYQSSSSNNDFPMNLLPDLELYTSLEIIFLFLILNSVLSAYIINKNFNYSKYIPKNKIGKFIEFLLKRYLRTWSASSTFVFSLSWICLLICILMSKLCLFYLLQV